MADKLFTKKQLKQIAKLKTRADFVTYFVSTETLSGTILLLVTVFAVYIANSSYSNTYFELFSSHLSISFADHNFSMSLLHWINDVLMAIFFLVVGMEIKKDMIVGELSSVRQASFPIIAAIGGMIVPAIIYLSLNKDYPTGFGIPMATDIAFALGILMLLGKRVNVSLKLFLVTLAVVDDLGAIIVVAIFYATELNYIFFLYSALAYLSLMLLNFFGVKRILPYILLGIVLWICVHSSGIHSTIAGVLLAFVIPLKTKDFTKDYEYKNSPLDKLSLKLHNFSAFVIMPLFAFANAGVTIDLSSVLTHKYIVLGVSLGLIFGKPIGIVTVTYLSTILKIAVKPVTVSWKEIIAAGFLGGIGFTMSIFISHLAFSDESIVSAVKLGIFVSSITAAILGTILIILVNPKGKYK